jgi:DNA-binding NarL/FixJ family response regulator
MHPESVCVNAAHFKNHSFVEVINMVETFSKLLNPHNTVTISIGVNHDTPYDLVKQAQKSSVMGIIPNVEFGHQETLRGLDAQFSNIPYWPRHVLEQLPGGPKNKSTANSTAINLTTRQQQLFDIVTTRGCSNKQAAKLLDISESTVKLHLSAIFKKYGVKNRTQLAVFSKRPN